MELFSSGLLRLSLFSGLEVMKRVVEEDLEKG
jgi:hypothetical protein